MARKRKSEMTLQERVDSALRGETWEYAEEFGIEVLARCMAKHAYAMTDGEEYLLSLSERICKRADAWAHEGDNPFVLAMLAVGQKIKNKAYESNYDNQTGQQG